MRISNPSALRYQVTNCYPCPCSPQHRNLSTRVKKNNKIKSRFKNFLSNIKNIQSILKVATFSLPGMKTFDSLWFLTFTY